MSFSTWKRPGGGVSSGPVGGQGAFGLAGLPAGEPLAEVGEHLRPCRRRRRPRRRGARAPGPAVEGDELVARDRLEIGLRHAARRRSASRRGAGSSTRGRRCRRRRRSAASSPRARCSSGPPAAASSKRGLRSMSKSRSSAFAERRRDDVERRRRRGRPGRARDHRGEEVGLLVELLRRSASSVPPWRIIAAVIAARPVSCPPARGRRRCGRSPGA